MPPKKAATAKATIEIETDTKQNHVSIELEFWLNQIYSLEKTWWRKSTTDRNWTIKSKKDDK